MQVSHNIRLKVADSDYTYFARDSDDDQVADGFTAAEAGTLILPGTGDLRDLPTGDVAVASGVFIEVDGPTTVQLTATAAILIQPAPNGGSKGCLLFEGQLGPLKAAAATAGQTVQGRYVVWGESASDPDAS